MCRSVSPRTLVVLALLAMLLGCDREERRFREAPPSSKDAASNPMSSLEPGERLRRDTIENPYERNAQAVSEGKRLFSWFNCSGCHGNGGGGMGPALMDDKWIYGADPASVYRTIVEGRPNGMPSFRGRLGETQVWELVAYVRSLSGLVRPDVAGGRSDDMMPHVQEQMRDRETPKASTTPGASEGTTP